MPPEPRILLDECLPSALWRAFPVEILVHSVRFAGFEGLKNGRLLAAARRKYDVIVTVDQGFEGEQDIASSELALVTIEAGSQAVEILGQYVPIVLVAARALKPGETMRLRPDSLEAL